MEGNCIPPRASDARSGLSDPPARSSGSASEVDPSFVSTSRASTEGVEKMSLGNGGVPPSEQKPKDPARVGSGELTADSTIPTRTPTSTDVPKNAQYSVAYDSEIVRGGGLGDDGGNTNGAQARGPAHASSGFATSNAHTDAEQPLVFGDIEASRGEEIAANDVSKVAELVIDESSGDGDSAVEQIDGLGEEVSASDSLTPLSQRIAMTRSDSAPPSLSGEVVMRTQFEAAATLAALSAAAASSPTKSSAVASQESIPSVSPPAIDATQRVRSDSSSSTEQQQRRPPHHHHQHSQPNLPPTQHAVSVGSMPTGVGAIAPFSNGQFQQPQQAQQRTVASSPSPPPLTIPSGTQPAHTGTDIGAGSGQGTGDAVTLMNSPRGQHDIVERSPGGRYVRFMERLGSGAYKDVYRAYDTIEGIEVAWNVVTLSGVPKTERSRIVNEVRLLERLHHHNIISFHGSWVNREREQVIFVTEILSSGTLKSFINKVQVIRWKIAKRWAVQILKGLEYLHSHEPPIIHRDLKCDNIFINGTSGDLRIGDLGLSTMISNKDQVRSVLGTPEFMAPELYDEVYDEKVDIYAFGMCLLEIFTKELPYRECSNPAQIYKKVSKDILPKSLDRVRSPEAREFIRLCLGTHNGSGGYKRPCASELLKHPFLAKGADDDSEVEVDPPLMKRAIPELPIVVGPREGGGESGASNFTSSTRGPSEGDLATTNTSALPPPVESSDVSSYSKGTAVQIGETGPNAAATTNERGQTKPPQTAPGPGGAEVSVPRATHHHQPLQHSSGNDEADHFSGMPETELNIKKVKVLMGKGVEIDDDDNDGRPPPPSHALTAHDKQSDVKAETDKPAVARSNSSSPGGDSANAPAPESQYLVAAAVVQEEHAGEKPYHDDILKLIITLPVEGQTQNVQFDFHLVEDDPVQVAREMVTELHIPRDAVLEISETISGLARAARMKQDRYNQQRRQQEHLMAQQAMQQQGVVAPQQPPRAQEQILAQQAMQQQGVVPPQQPPGGPVTESSSSKRQHTGSAANQDRTTPVVQSNATPAGDAPVTRPQATNLSVKQHRQAVAGTTAMGPKPGTTVAREGHVPAQVTISNDVGCATQRAAAPQGQTYVQKRKTGTTPNRPDSFASDAKSIQTVMSMQTKKEATPRSQTGGDKGMLSDGNDSVESEEESDSEELRRLEADYQKNLLRAKKAFDTRMENLQRSKEEKEAQHLKTLEKHEKEKAEFEKRVKQAEAEQNRRLEQLQLERDRQREVFMKQGGGSKQRDDPQQKSGSWAKQRSLSTEAGTFPTQGTSQPPAPGTMPPQQAAQPGVPRQRPLSASSNLDGSGVVAGVSNKRERSPSGSNLSSRDSTRPPVI